jgi:hypothetical protein
MVVERYRLKTKSKIVMVSTPYRPGGLFQQIELDQDSPYHKLFLHYSIGGKIYNPEEIEKERQQFYFKREYELNYSVAIGNIFTEPEIEACEELGRHHTKFNQEQYGSKDYVNSSTQKSMGIDWGFGSSKTAFVVTAFIDDGICRIIYAKEFANQSVDGMINHAYKLIRKYNLDNWENKTFVDASSPGKIRSLKNAISGTNETVDYYLLVKRATEDKRPLDLYMQIVPVNFSTDGRQMLDKLLSTGK